MQNTESTRGPYTIRARDDLGNDSPGKVHGEHLTRDAMLAWIDTHADEGTFEVIDEADGQEACGYDTLMAGGAWACDCERPSCATNCSAKGESPSVDPSPSAGA